MNTKKRILSFLRWSLVLIIIFVYFGGYSATHDVFIDYYYFGDKDAVYALIAVFVLFCLMMGTILYFSSRPVSSPASSQSRENQEIQRKGIVYYFNRINSLVYFLIGIAVIFAHFYYSKQVVSSKYDVIYAYGTTEALSRVSVQDGRIILSDDDIVIYYYSFRHPMWRVERDESSMSKSKTIPSNHEITVNNLSKFKIISSASISPDNMGTNKSFGDYVFSDNLSMIYRPGQACVLRATGHTLYSYEGGLKYGDCRVIGWIKGLY